VCLEELRGAPAVSNGRPVPHARDFMAEFLDFPGATTTKSSRRSKSSPGDRASAEWRDSTAAVKIANHFRRRDEARAAEIVSYFLVGLGLRVAGDRWAAAQSPKIGILSARAAATCRSSKLANSTI